MVDLILKYLLIAMLILQIIVLIQLFICQAERHKADKKFWETMIDKAMKNSEESKTNK